MTVKQYRQCRLRRGLSETVAWIETRGATRGAHVEILPTGSIWTVTHVYDHVMPENVLRDIQMLNRHSLPSIEAIV